mgnify:CR=1 FL=1
MNNLNPLKLANKRLLWGFRHAQSKFEGKIQRFLDMNP